jgi:hypothetical protein
MKEFHVDMEKMKNLVHYICAYFDRSLLGKTKLNKILWFCDTEAYQQVGNPITGETYVKQKFGPVPSHIDEVLQLLYKEGKLIEREAPCYCYTKKEFISLKRPDVSGFTPQEIEIINEIASTVCDNFTASEISEATHDALWQTAEIGESLPYECTLIESFPDPTPDVAAWIEEVSRELAEKCVCE